MRRPSVLVAITEEYGGSAVRSAAVIGVFRSVKQARSALGALGYARVADWPSSPNSRVVEIYTGEGRRQATIERHSVE